MSDDKMPDRIWITQEDFTWPSFRRFHASSLDHGGRYPEYVRADLFEALNAENARLKDEINRLRNPLHILGDQRRTVQVPRPLKDTEA